MFYLFANSWGWLAIALAIGLIVGFLTTTRAQKEFSGGWVILVGALFLVAGFVASFNGAFTGRSALFADAALLLATAYAIGLPLGGGAKLFTAAPATERPARRPQIVVVRGKARESEPESEMLKETGSDSSAASTAVALGEVAEASTTADERIEAPASASEAEAASVASVPAAEEPAAVVAEAAEIAAQVVAPVATAGAAEQPAAVVVEAETVETSIAADAEEETPIATTVAAREPASPFVVAPPAPVTAVGNGSGKKPAGARPDALEAPRGGKPDDLSKIKGVGPKSREKLHALGVFHYDQIAAWTPEQARWIGGALGVPGRVERGRWVAQAKSLASGKTQAHPE